MNSKNDFSPDVQEAVSKSVILMKYGVDRKEAVREAVDDVAGDHSEEYREDLYSVVDKEWPNLK